MACTRIQETRGQVQKWISAEKSQWAKSDVVEVRDIPDRLKRDKP